MTDNPQQAMEQLALALYYRAAEMMKEGKSGEEIVQWLIEKGVRPATAERMLARLQVSRRNVTHRAGRYNVVAGVLICALGLAIAGDVILVPTSTLLRIVSLLAVIPGVYIILRGTLQLTR